MDRTKYSLDHLEHERASTAKEVISSPDPAKDLIDDSYLGAIGRHKAPTLGQNADDGCLS
jgi:hypothetical protein